MKYKNITFYIFNDEILILIPSEWFISFLKYYFYIWSNFEKHFKVFPLFLGIKIQTKSHEEKERGLKLMESKERSVMKEEKIERNNLIYIYSLFKNNLPFFLPNMYLQCENALGRVNIYNCTVKSVPRANIQLILNSFGKSASEEMQISRSDLGHTRPESWTTQTETQIYLETESCFTHCTKHEAPSCSHNENFPHGFCPCEVSPPFDDRKRKRKV